jgi:multiple sugar transport system ATP-binding protein
MSQIDVKQVWKIYPRGNVVGVKDLTLACRDKEFLAILGPSGGGKSSTLRMLAGLEEISRGEILFDGKVVNPLGPAERNVALAFESYALYQRLTVYENIAFPLRARKMEASEVDRKVSWIAELLDLTSVLGKYPSSLAGGHQQRVSLARAFVRKPNVTLLDEPISHMDQRVRAALRARIRRLHDELGLTTVYVTHDQAEAISLADRIAIINKAELQQIGTIDAIWNQPANRFVAYFVGEPAMNFIPAELVDQQHVAGRIRCNDWCSAAADQGVAQRAVDRGSCRFGQDRRISRRNDGADRNSGRPGCKRGQGGGSLRRKDCGRRIDLAAFRPGYHPPVRR